MNTQLDVVQHAKDMDARDPRSRVQGARQMAVERNRGGSMLHLVFSLALAVSRFGQFSKNFVELCD